MKIRRAILGTIVLVLVVAVAAGWVITRQPRRASPEERTAWAASIASLEREQDSLRVRSAELIAADPRILGLPKGEVVVAVPTAFISQVMERLFDDVVDRVTLRIGGIKAHVAKTIKKVVTVGEFTVDVNINQVVGRIHPGKPTITYGDSIRLTLPITIKEGHGDATIHFVWNGKHVADLACGDLDITQNVSGDVIPADYVVKGALGLKVEGRRVIGAMRFPETRIRVRVKPSKESWDAINAILEEKRGVCGWVLDKVNVPSILENLTETKGFNIRLPIDKLKPAVLPAGIRDSVTVGGRALAIAAQTKTIRIDRDAIWYSAAVKVEGVPPATSAPDSLPVTAPAAEPAGAKP